MYISLHVHTAKGSVGDSILKIPDYVKKIKQLKMPAATITNHGSMADMIEFYNECKKNDVKAIIGCEVYIAKDRTLREKGYHHLVLIAKNKNGLRNLLKIVSDASLNGFYKRPRTDFEFLSKHSEGLVCLSACVGGEIPQMILNYEREEDEAIREEIYHDIVALINAYKSCFKDFYLEIQPGEFEDQKLANQMLIELSHETNTPLVITNDVHYLDKEDWYPHDIHVKNQRKSTSEELVYPDKCYYLMEEAELRSKCTSINEKVLNQAISNTQKIADMCQVELTTNKLNMPFIETPKGFNEDEYLELLAVSALTEKASKIKDPAKYLERVFYELDVIKELGFSGYFLTMRDLILAANERGIPVGPGRGSICGSEVAYLIGVSKVDAIKYNLLFERFLSKHRKGSVPDIDTDFCSLRRKEMFDYTIQKHGVDKCALVSTFGMRKAKSSLKDVARVLGIDLEIADQASKLIPISHYDEEGNKATDLSIVDSLRIVPELRAMQKQYPEWFSLAIKLEDIPRVTSIHAAGTLIASTPLVEEIPLINKDGSDINATALNLKDAEDAGFIKFDYLGLATLSIVDGTEKLTGFKFDYDNDDLYNDEAVWNLIGSRYTTTLFQIGSSTYKQRMGRLKPKTIQELAACLALVRGPCISSKQDEVYMNIIEGKQEVELIHPFYDEPTASTNGILLYQEQIMQIAVNFGFSLEDGFKLMKAVAKKNIDAIESYADQFKEKADEHNVPAHALARIWQIILDAGLYCFNESHAVAYALLCYVSAYYKTYYPLEWMTNALTNAYARKEEIPETIQECRRMGIQFEGLDVNTSSYDFAMKDNKIALGMIAIKGFGEKASDEIISKRPFVNFEDFVERVEKSKCKKNQTTPAIFSGLFDCFGTPHDIFTQFCVIRKEEVPVEIKLQGAKEKINLKSDIGSIEEEILGARIMHSPVNMFEPFDLDMIPDGKIFTCDALITKVARKTSKAGKKFGIIDLMTASGNIECIAFEKTLKEYSKQIKKNKLVKITAKRSIEDKTVIFNVTEK